MDTQDSIAWAARAEAYRGLRPLTDDAELLELSEAGAALPVLQVTRGSGDRLVVAGRGHEGHDNEGRMAPVCDFLQRRVLPYVEPGADVTGAYRIELHDSYSYLPRDRGVYDNALTFCRPRAAREASVVVPDPYQMAAFGGMLSVPDTVPWAAKRPTLFFAGTTTGDRDPARNERIAACRWALQTQPRDVADFRITHVAQMTLERCRAAVPRFDELLHAPVPHADHFGYRYQVNIAGNTACWSRVPMVLASGCLLVHLRTHQDMAWYYPFLRQDEHYVGAPSVDALPTVRSWCLANDGACQQVVARASRFVNDYLSPMQAALYWVKLLEAAAERGRA
jgi:Glycosyl transferase family 90